MIKTRSKVTAADVDKARVSRELFEKFGPAPYTQDQYAAVAVDIAPDPDPVTRAEQRAARKFEKELAEAREVEERASGAYEAAEKSLRAALLRLQRTGGGALQVDMSGQPIPPTPASREEVESARAAEADARTAFEAAEDALFRARVALNKIEHQLDYAVHVARS